MAQSNLFESRCLTEAAAWIAPLMIRFVPIREEVFICPDCNCEVADPEFIPAPPWWRRPRGMSRRPTPVCPAGHKLRRQVLGNLTELNLPLAFLRGLCISVAALVMAILDDLRLTASEGPHLGLMMMAGLGLVFGTIAFTDAWIWAGLIGPVHRLASRACGVALGFAVPAIVASHALYFHWAAAAEAAFGEALLHLLEPLLQR